MITLGFLCVVGLFLAWDLVSRTDLLTKTDFTIFGDSSLVGATVLVDGIHRGTFSGVRAVRTYVLGKESDPLHWPGQVAGDTVFTAGDINGSWSAKIKNGTHDLVLSSPDGRVLRARISLGATMVEGLASFDRNHLHTWIESY